MQWRSYLTFDLSSNNKHLKSNQDIKRFRSRGNVVVGSLLKPEKLNTDFVALLNMVENGMYNKRRQYKVTLF